MYCADLLCVICVLFLCFWRSAVKMIDERRCTFPRVEFRLYEDQDSRTSPSAQFVSSKDITVGGLVWRVNCYPRGISNELAPEHMSIYLHLVSKSKEVKAIFDAFVMEKSAKPHCHRLRTGLATTGPREWGYVASVRKMERS